VRFERDAAMVSHREAELARVTMEFKPERREVIHLVTRIDHVKRPF
jgi:hypothetical protein